MEPTTTASSYVVQYRVAHLEPWRDLPREPGYAALEDAWSRAQALAARRQAGSTVRYRVAAVWVEVDRATA